MLIRKSRVGPFCVFNRYCKVIWRQVVCGPFLEKQQLRIPVGYPNVNLFNSICTWIQEGEKEWGDKGPHGRSRHKDSVSRRWWAFGTSIAPLGRLPRLWTQGVPWIQWLKASDRERFRHISKSSPEGNSKVKAEWKLALLADTLATTNTDLDEPFPSAGIRPCSWNTHLSLSELSRDTILALRKFMLGCYTRPIPWLLYWRAQ